MLKISTKALILVAGLVWLAGGAAVISAGLSASPSPWTLPMGAGALGTYLPFLVLFLLIARKHIRRITGYTERLTNIFLFLDLPSYLIFIVMIGMGTILRLSGVVPGAILTPFYCGLGLALLTAAAFYLVTYVCICDELLVEKQKVEKPEPAKRSTPSL